VYYEANTYLHIILVDYTQIDGLSLYIIYYAIIASWLQPLTCLCPLTIIICISYKNIWWLKHMPDFEALIWLESFNFYILIDGPSNLITFHT